MPRPTTLAAWLAYLETLHPKSIEMGLARVRDVAARLPLALGCPAITVTGTNGKGSTCALLEAILRCSGHRVGLYTSPHLLRYNERVRIDGSEASDADLLAAFNAVEDARRANTNTEGTPLTYFEFGTLAALWLFANAKLDALILEVGLGGRLDAVNIVDPEAAVVTTIAIDHVDYLGSTRDDIAREKAGIFRANRSAICGDRDPPRTLIDHATIVGARLLRIGVDFDFNVDGTQWAYRGPGGDRYGLPMPALRGSYQVANAAVAIATLDSVRDRVPVTYGAIREALVSVELPGRFQVLPGRPTIVLDVAHNPHAAAAFADALGAMGFYPQTHAVFGMLADKDVRAVVDAIKARIDLWYVAGLPGPRGASAALVIDVLIDAGVALSTIHSFDTIESAFRAARDRADDADRIVVFGSFLTVGAAMATARRGVLNPRIA